MKTISDTKLSVIILADGTGVSTALQSALEGAGHGVTMVQQPASLDATKLGSALDAAGLSNATHVVDLWSLDAISVAELGANNSVKSTEFVQQATEQRCGQTLK